jgi:two-component system sensor histidine kinase YesM
MKGGLKRNLGELAGALFALLIIIWGVFFTLVSGLIASDAEQRAALASTQIIESLTRELSGLEKAVSALAVGLPAKRFVSETQLSERYALADEMAAERGGAALEGGFINHALIYDNYGGFYRLAGNLSYSSCVSLGYLLARSDYPGHIVRESEGVTYIGYQAKVYDENGARVGAAVMLSERENILDTVSAAAPDSSLIVSVMAGDEIIASSGGASAKAGSKIQTLSTKQIGLTPFAVQVAVDEGQLGASVRWFSLAAAVTALIFIMLLLVFMRLINRRFFTPMLSVIGHVKTLGSGGTQRRLPPVDDDEFDALIGGVNDMLDRIEKGGEQLRVAEAKLKNNEIQKQKAIIFSLKKQINAHFTINTLSAVQALADSGAVAQAGEILSKLSALIRYAYAEGQLIGVWEELQITGDYIDVMNIRHNNKITAVFNLDDRLMDYRMPRMLLQPIVENAITHGFINRSADCAIEIRAQLLDKRIAISVADNGEGMSEENLSQLRERLEFDAEDTPGGIGGIALVNIRRQLRSFYGDEASFLIESVQGEGTTVTLLIPAER